MPRRVTAGVLRPGACFPSRPALEVVVRSDSHGPGARADIRARRSPLRSRPTVGLLARFAIAGVVVLAALAGLIPQCRRDRWSA